MNPNDPNVQMMDLVAARLGDTLRNELVFVGGAVAGLLITDPGQPTIRPTEDVDLIVHAASRSDFNNVEAALRQRGFTHDLSKDGPLCRWHMGAVTIDVMPTLPEILGFSNRWYPLALATAEHLTLPSKTTIRIVTAPVFLATKFEAFDSRGQGDYLFSHDLGDIIAVIDGRAELLAECAAADRTLQGYLGERFRTLLATPAFCEALPGHLPGDMASQDRLPELIETLEQLAMLG